MARACSVCASNCLRLHGPQGENEEDVAQGETAEDAGAVAAATCSQEEAERSPSFLKKMATSTMSSLKLPLSFVRGQMDRLDAQCVTLEGPSRGKWKVELQGSFQTFNLHFGQGWEKFVADHALQVDDLLTFSLSAKSYFQVEVYDGGGCLKTSALDAEVAEAQLTEPVVNAVQTAASVATRPVVETVAVAEVAEAEVEAGAEAGAEATRSVSGTGERSEGLYDPDSVTVAEATRSASEIGERSEGLYDPDSEDDKVSEQKLLPEHRVVKGCVLSRRPPVTEQERERALQAAKSLELANPSCLLVMSKQNVYKGFWLGIPKQFGKKWMPSKNREVKLVNRGGHSWPVKWIASRSGLSSGWRRFSLDHRLEEHDVCVLELIDPARSVLLARIFRVLQSPEEDPGLYPHTVSPQTGTKRKLSSPEADGEGSDRKSSRKEPEPEPERGLPDDDHIPDDAEASHEHIDYSPLPGDDITYPEAEDPRETRAPESTTQLQGPALIRRCGPDVADDNKQPRKARSQQEKVCALDPDSVITGFPEASPPKGKETAGPDPAETVRTRSDPGPSNRRAAASVRALICFQNRSSGDQSSTHADPDDVHEQIMLVPELTGRRKQQQRKKEKEKEKEKEPKQKEYKVVHIYSGRDVGKGTEYLSELEGYAGACLERDDDTGFWWVPHEQFGWDMMRCYVQ